LCKRAECQADPKAVFYVMELDLPPRHEPAKKVLPVRMLGTASGTAVCLTVSTYFLHLVLVLGAWLSLAGLHMTGTPFAALPALHCPTRFAFLHHLTCTSRLPDNANILLPHPHRALSESLKKTVPTARDGFHPKLPSGITPP
jgi:hypothetical protein